MMALYRRIWKAGKWREWKNYSHDKGYNFSDDSYTSFEQWLFCLSGKGYEERCQMVDEFLEEG